MNRLHSRKIFHMQCGGLGYVYLTCTAICIGAQRRYITCGEMSRWLRLAAQRAVVGLRADRPVFPQAAREKCLGPGLDRFCFLTSMCRVRSHRGSKEAMLIRSNSVNNEF